MKEDGFTLPAASTVDGHPRNTWKYLLVSDNETRTDIGYVYKVPGKKAKYSEYQSDATLFETNEEAEKAIRSLGLSKRDYSIRWGSYTNYDVYDESNGSIGRLMRAKMFD
jgi:hypothetical protein